MPEPWQADAIDLMLAVRADDRWQHRTYAELCPRQNGKTAIFEMRALAALFLLGEMVTLWSSHEYRTTLLAFRRLRGRLLRLAGGRWANIRGTLLLVDGVPIKVNNTNGDEGFERLDTGQLIQFTSRSKNAGRGFTTDVLLADEAFAITDEQAEAMLPTQLVAPNPQVAYASSPPLDGISGEILWRLRDRIDSDQPEPALCWRDWGADGDLENLDGRDLADPQLWRATNPATATGRLTLESIADQARGMSDRAFARECLGIWPRRAAAAAAVIDPAVWRDLAATAERPDGQAFAAVVAADRSRTAIVACGPRSDGRLQLSVVEWRPGTAWVPARLAQLHQAWSPVATAVQDKGASATLLAPLAERGLTPPADRDRPQHGDLAVPYAADVAVAYGLLIDALDQRSVVHLDEQPLNLAVAQARTRPLGTGTAWTYDGEYDAVLIAATLAVWAWTSRSAAVNDYDVLQSIY